ncbi:MAG: GNAT family N-acetyltransferase [Rubrobacteraceae bacterium]
MSTSNYSNVALRLSVLDVRFAVCRLEPDHKLPEWLLQAEFFSITRTPDELSIVCPKSDVPDGLSSETGWRALKLEGPFEFSMTGVLVSVAEPLAAAGVSIFAISTYDTDYVFVKQDALNSAISALRGAGHELYDPASSEGQTFAIRPATVEDEPFLWQMLAEAAQENTVRNVVENPGTARYVKGWGREGDLGVIAVSNHERPIGAAWLRLLTNENRGYGYVNDETPEVAIAAHPDFRGTGVGTQLLVQLLEKARDICHTVCLSVRADNPALRLYERMGFEIVRDSEKHNREGGSSLTMMRNL